MERVAITGASGYIGSRLLSRLEGLDHVESVIGIDLKPPQNISPKLRFYSQDILQPLGDVFAENKVDYAIHLAFILKPTHDRSRARRIDISGASNFLEACRQAQVKHILYLSSHTVYGAHRDNPIPLTEDSPLRPLHGFQYSWDKAESERVFREFTSLHKDICVTILRSCPVIGPNAGNSVVASMFTPVMIRVAGYDPPMQFVHEDDLVELITVLLEHRQGGIFNVAGEGQLPYSEIARLFRRKTVVLPGRLLRLLLSFLWALRLQNESPASGLEFIKYPPVVSTEKLKGEVEFKFKYSSREALMSFIAARR